ncbi:MULTISPECIES: GNAT family N-acetyltransferase [unclassified Streptomyces]|uniref:GNAT family N-acetyltransferase n=1 Tax=unclassified Streptomyces TaxID=2593676 RepID=UPI003808D040
MTTELRVLKPAEWERWFGSCELAFGGIPEEATERALWSELTECDRSIGVWDGEDCVGTAGAFGLRLSVPGGAVVPAAGVTTVSVASTHRRRGILTSMMRRQLDDIRSWGEPLAVLTASEPVIYGRYGYGAATQFLAAEIDTARVRLPEPERTDRPDGVRLRRVKADDPAVREACEALYAADVAGRPGMLARRPGWERRPVVGGGKAADGRSALQCVLAERHGEAAGFALFRLRPDWDRSGPKGTVELKDLHAGDPAAYASLWRFLFGIDLMSTVEAGNRPVDDAFQYLVSDFRRCRVRLQDSLYLRPVEVGAALSARTYRAPVDVVLAVEDAFCPWNEGSWRLSGDAGGASCERTGDTAELALSVRELGAAYLGGTSLTALARAGRVTELRPGALAAASEAFGSDVAPWLPHGF